MKIPSPLRILLKAILTPLLAVFFLNKFNLFEYVTFVPDEYTFDVGLMLYLALIEALYEIIKQRLSKSMSEIECVFYERKDSIDIRNTPMFVCDSQTCVTTISCRIRLRGNVNSLRKCKLVLSLPEWLSSQLADNHIALEYSDNKLTWNFNRFLSDGTVLRDNYAEINVRVPVILATGTKGLFTTIRPVLDSSGQWVKRAVLRSNSVQIRSEE